MSEQDLINEVERSYMSMPRGARIAAIKKLAAQSRADDRFLRRTFPRLYAEAFRPARSSKSRLEKPVRLR